MTAVDDITSLRQRREAIVNQHVEAENRHDIEATIATFAQPRYEVNGAPSEGAEAVRELLQGLMIGLPDLHAELGKMRHADDAVFGEGLITGTHNGEWAGIPPTGRRIEIPIVGIFEFDGDRLLCEKVYFDMATVLIQMGVLPAIS
ncbi:ester cyclase [Mycobacterium mantenii]|uniref:Ester cyclase n=1 Tax=Mycobacterium mantenii TaxID=560555 RepID=A0A1A2T5P3_MYCNT|nr:ester cyclase [Mycobacterium mantenii]OBH41310.1 hypothetical protein A5688_17930 [Mycobacterium mantenii]OBH48750.1 hypothetical protein A5687_15145 [Mycobacterium mantenii]OBH68783.1 hypothetical protein A5683_07120 [Mycobacterium mantenii]OBH71754.1 hypothetical protein A5682_00945 [Mycobacterium mantenii]